MSAALNMRGSEALSIQYNWLIKRSSFNGSTVSSANAPSSGEKSPMRLGLYPVEPGVKPARTVDAGTVFAISPPSKYLSRRVVVGVVVDVVVAVVVAVVVVQVISSRRQSTYSKSVKPEPWWPSLFTAYSIGRNLMSSSAT